MPQQTKIGFNPEGRFMTTIEDTLVVVRKDGTIFGSDVVDGQAQTCFEFGGAKIGFNPQDQFIMTLAGGVGTRGTSCRRAGGVRAHRRR